MNGNVFIKRVAKGLLKSKNGHVKQMNVHGFKTSLAGFQKTWFGNEYVKEEVKQKNVNAVFDNVASTYDKMNDCMSLGLHKLWKTHFVKKILPNLGEIHIDVAGGTGDIAFKLYMEIMMRKTWPRSNIYICDINKNMIQVGKKRAHLKGYDDIQFIVCDGENLPFPESSVNSYSIAFGIRNFGSISQGLRDAYRVLKPGCKFFCMEFSKVENFPIFNSIYIQYLNQLLPVMGEIVAGDFKSYDYLAKSIQKFPDQVEFGAMMEEAGFKEVVYENLLFGAVAIHSGVKK